MSTWGPMGRRRRRRRFSWWPAGPAPAARRVPSAAAAASGRWVPIQTARQQAVGRMAAWLLAILGLIAVYVGWNAVRQSEVVKRRRTTVRMPAGVASPHDSTGALTANPATPSSAGPPSVGGLPGLTIAESGTSVRIEAPAGTSMRAVQDVARRKAEEWKAQQGFGRVRVSGYERGGKVEVRIDPVPQGEGGAASTR